MAWMMLITTMMMVTSENLPKSIQLTQLNHNPIDHLLPKEHINVTRVYVIHFIYLCIGVVRVIIPKLIGLDLNHWSGLFIFKFLSSSNHAQPSVNGSHCNNGESEHKIDTCDSTT